jgi:RNA polymerase sigma factor (sigma-70 family)
MAPPATLSTPSDLARFYARYGGAVFRRARRLLRSESGAEDACQEVFVRLWRARPDFAAASPVTWLYRVTTNYCLNQIRNDRRRRIGEQSASEATAASFELSLSLLLRGLPESLHELALYYYVDQLSQAEIAPLLGVSQRTVSTRLRELGAALESAWDVRIKEAT